MVGVVFVVWWICGRILCFCECVCIWWLSCVLWFGLMCGLLYGFGVLGWGWCCWFGFCSFVKLVVCGLMFWFGWWVCALGGLFTGCVAFAFVYIVTSVLWLLVCI